MVSKRLRAMRLLATLAALGSVTVLGGIAETAGATAPDAKPSPSVVHGSTARNVYFGNVHIHTAWSFDGFANGAMTGPDDAYRWAKGEAIPGGGNGGPMQIRTPLDFYAVSEHAEYMGVFVKMRDPESPFSKLPIAKRITSPDRAEAFAAFAAVLDDLNRGVPQPELNDPLMAANLWKEIIDIADAHYDPGVFTTFPAFEWTSAPDNRNLHRVVVFQSGEGVPERPFSTADSTRPEDLWDYMDAARADGATLMAIPHNGNASDGLMFSLRDSFGEAFDAAYVEARTRNESLYEISQIKGTSETHPQLSPNDEFAAFEQWDYTLSAIPERPTQRAGSFLRQALLDGVAMEAEGRGNPFRYGVIGDSDSHNSAASIEEDNHTGKFAVENRPQSRLNGPLPNEDNNRQVRQFSSGGVAAVWADANTREDIFAAMSRRETYGTSGTRMTVRLFAGWDFAPDLLQAPDWVASAYARGVPMGGYLQSGPEGRAPSLVIAAMKEADGANLDRIQVVKGWVQEGEARERIYNVAWSGERELTATGALPAVGNTVDVAAATYSNSIGSVELKSIWVDPDFDASQPAFYYVRVLEIPTPRWSTYDARALGVPPREDLPPFIQERAWTSPIWYTP